MQTHRSGDVTLRQNDSCVSFCMFPLPSRGRDWTPGKGGKDRSRTPFGNKGKGNKGKPGKGKSGKGKKGPSSSQQSPWGSSRKPSMPKELRHLNPQDDKGRRYCYGWNLEEGPQNVREACVSAWSAAARTMGQRPAQPTRKSDSRPDRVGPCPTNAEMTPEESPSVPADLPQPCGTVSTSVQPAGRTPVFVEVFCGLARLSKAARDRGFSCAPIDHANKASGIKVLHIDLCGQAGRSLLKGVLENPDVRWVHWAPPCGTFSRKTSRLKSVFAS